jgi:hypothetical protein
VVFRKESRVSLLHPAILYGLGLVALPVLLHLLMKQKPKKLLFPALQLIANRRKQNVNRMRLRHFWLLLLRMLVIGLLVFAIARPSVPAADYSLNLREMLTIAGLLVLAVAAYSFASHRWRRSELPRHERRYRQTQLRSWLIGGTIVLLLLLVGWPYQRRITADLKAPTPTGDVSLPVAAVFLFDTSLSMSYQQEGRTRLNVARELAIEHMGDLAAGSRVAIADVASDNPILFQTTISSARNRIESLEPHALSLPLNDRIRSALRLHRDDRERTLAEQGAVAAEERKDRFLRRIYVFSDLAQSAFRVGGTSRLAAELQEQPNVNLFLVDVSHPSPVNTAITRVQPQRTTVTQDGELIVSATVVRHEGAGGSAADAAPAADAGGGANEIATGGGVSTTLELLLHEGGGRPIKVAQQSVELAAGVPQQVTFGPLAVEKGPVLHGDVRLVSSDPMAFDDTRRFTVEVRPPVPVLVVAPSDDDSLSWTVALEIGGYKVTERRPNQLPQVQLADYAVICLINVPSLPDNDWYRLGQYVQSGGGLAVMLGSTDLEYGINYVRDEAQVFLPGRPQAHSAPGVSYLRIANQQHPLFQPLQENEGMALLEAADIDRFWRVEPTDDARIVAHYSDRREAPAILERVHGQGRTLMLTTAVDLKDFRRRWNILANPLWTGAWTYLMLADGMMRYLSHQSEARLTYDVGESPVLRLSAEDEPRSFLLQRPGFRQSRVSLAAGESVVRIEDAGDVGHYDLKTTGEPSRVASGFSVNAKAAESDLTRIETNRLDEMFGEERYQVARSIGELQENINIADLGRELFPLLLTALILFFVGEHFVANWFYESETGSESTSTWKPASAPPASEPAVAASSS